MRKYAGTTFIEVLLYVSIFSLLFLLITNSYYFIISSINKNQTVNNVNFVSQHSLNTLTKTIGKATDIILPTSGESLSSLTLEMPNSSNNPTQFFVTNNILYIKEGNNQELALTPPTVNVDSVNFTNVSTEGSGVKSVKVILTLSSVGLTYEKQFSSTFYATATIQ